MTRNLPTFRPPASLRSRCRGVTLTEILIVLGIMAALTLSILAYGYATRDNAYASTETERFVRGVNVIRNVYATKADVAPGRFDGLSLANLTNSGFPEIWGAAPVHSWGGSVGLVAGFDASTGSYFEITLGGLPRAACLNLATSTNTGAVRVLVNANLSEPVRAFSDTLPSLARAQAQCSQPTNALSLASR